jgi:hypothetical protein
LLQQWWSFGIFGVPNCLAKFRKDFQDALDGVEGPEPPASIPSRSLPDSDTSLSTSSLTMALASCPGLT